MSKFKTFIEWSIHNRIHNGKDFKCSFCDGWGRIYDPDDPPDIYEGNKMRDTITCSACKGSKIGNESSWKLVYKNQKDRHNEYKKRDADNKKKIKSIISKLTKEECDYIGLKLPK